MAQEQMTIIRGDARNYGKKTDLIFTDPPYEMSGKELSEILDCYECDHLVILTTMKQLIELLNSSGWQLNFDFVWDAVVPKKSKSMMQPNYVHQTGAYLTRNNAKSIFNRKRRGRSDTHDNGYWPTIFRAPRNTNDGHGHAKNSQAITDLLGCFDIKDVTDPFAGSGSTMAAAFELEINCTLIEMDAEHFELIKQIAKFMSVYGLKIVE